MNRRVGAAAALAEPVAAKIGAVPQPWNGKGTAHNRRFVDALSSSGRMLALQAERPRSESWRGNTKIKAGPVAVGAAAGP